MSGDEIFRLVLVVMFFVTTTILVCTSMVCGAWREYTQSRLEVDRRMLDLDEQEMKRDRGWE